MLSVTKELLVFCGAARASARATPPGSPIWLSPDGTAKYVKVCARGSAVTA